MIKPRLIILTRTPQPGAVKTRLIPKLGPDGAAQLHKQMAETTMSWARSLADRRIVSLQVWFDGGSREQMKQWLGEGLLFYEQGEGDLGERMARAVRPNAGKKRPVILVGTDCPQLNAGLVVMVLKEMKTHDLVIIPTVDGGYSLIGLKTFCPELFQSMEWGQDSVCKTTLRRAADLGLKTKVFEPLRDIDRPEDLSVWERASRQFLSIIIPTLNEGDHLGETLKPLLDLPQTEVIVADGGSRDGTASLARDLGAKMVITQAGRGNQMNHGAEAARGEILLFLHADTLLPANFGQAVQGAMVDPKYTGGSFAWHVHPSSVLLKVMEVTVNLRTRYCRLPYGDQGLFVRTSLFRQMGGFADIPLMEDVDFVRRMKKIGPLAVVPEAITTSARKYQKEGTLRTTMRNKLIFFGYSLGIPPERLHRYYYSRSEQDPSEKRGDL